jgi:hypothetical protein
MKENNQIPCLAVGCTEPMVTGTSMCHTHGIRVEGLIMSTQAEWRNGGRVGEPPREKGHCSFCDERLESAIRWNTQVGFSRFVVSFGVEDFRRTIFDTLPQDATIEEKRRDLEDLGFDLETLRPKDPHRLPLWIERWDDD